MVAERDGIRVYSCGCEVSVPTSLQDPERARQQRAQYPPPDEADWMGLLLGIGAAVTAIGLCVGATYALLGYL